MDTPISESAFIGLAIGAAVEGMRPIAELMFVDFFGVCMDQIYNHMAKIHYESGGNVRVPMVVTTAVGGGYSDGAQHSQCLWGTFAHLPGMKVVVPSTPYDAKGLMTAAIRDDNPVVYMFHKGVMGLPWMAKNPRATGPVPEEPYEVPIGQAAVVREGRDATVVTSRCRSTTRSTSPRSSPRDGIDLEVIDLRTLMPLDRETVLDVGGQDRPAARRRRGLPVLRPVRRDRGDRRGDRPGLLRVADAAGGRPRRADPVRPLLEYAVLPTPDRIAGRAPARRLR